MPCALVSVAPGTSIVLKTNVLDARAGASIAQTQHTPSPIREKIRIWPSFDYARDYWKALDCESLGTD